MDYQTLVERAMRGVVREALTMVEKDGLPGEHHLYVTFRTGDPGVEIADRLRDQYPDEMTIVLQYQFWGLEIGEKAFEVTLSFSGKNERLYIPFDAISGFADPSVSFGLQFNSTDSGRDAVEAADMPDAADPATDDTGETPDDDAEESPTTGEVVALDAFRKNKT